MKTRPGTEEDFKRAWQKVANYTRSVRGNIRQDLLSDLDDASSFVISSDWESLETFREFESSEEQDRVTAPLRQLRLSAQMTIHSLMAHVEKEEEA